MAFPAVATRLPPELFDGILFYVCEFASDLLNPQQEIPARKEAIKDIAACSLTCVYWARICRERIFQKIWIKNYEDLCRFSALASATPERFKPISALAERAILVLHVADRPWLHLLRLQPSLVPEMPLVRNYASIHFHIVDSSIADSGSPRRPTYRSVFSGLPRSLPPSCHQCDDLTIKNPYFRSEGDVKALLAKFGRRPYPRKHIAAWNVTLLDVMWDLPKAASDPLHSLIMGDTLEVKFAGISASVIAEGPMYTAETAWLAYSAMMRFHLRSSPLAIPDSRNIDTPLQLLPYAQKTILDVSKLLCPCNVTSKLLIYQYMWDPLLHKEAYMRRICSVKTGGRERSYPFEIFGFYAAQSTLDLLETSHPVIVDHISALCISIESSPRKPSPEELAAGAFLVAQQAIPALDKIVELCTGLERFKGLQLQFSHREDLVRFMEVRRETLKPLDGRVSLFYRVGGNYDWCLVNYESLADLGDARQHGYTW